MDMFDVHVKDDKGKKCAVSQKNLLMEEKQGADVFTVSRQTKESSVLGTDGRDCDELGINPGDREGVSPASYLMLHEAFSALHDSGIDYRAKPVGVYISVSGAVKGGSLAMMANRVGSVFDLTGPCVTIDAVCFIAREWRYFC
jgi:3-oxoacyl-(acyl-carrier-protein) synthase